MSTLVVQKRSSRQKWMIKSMEIFEDEEDLCNLVSVSNKRNRLTISKESLAMFNRDKKDFLRRFIIVDETWIHNNTPETQEQSKQSISQKGQYRFVNQQMMPTIFWDTHVINQIDQLQKNKTITGEYYLCRAIGPIRRHVE